MPSRSSFGSSDAAKKYARREYRSDRFAMPDIEALADLVTSARGRFWREAEDRSRPGAGSENCTDLPYYSAIGC